MDEGRGTPPSRHADPVGRPAWALTAGTVGVLSGDLGRFSDFAMSMVRLVRPPDTRVVWIKGMDVTANLNEIVKRTEGEWLWIMGDDHVFDPLILIQLLRREVDVVVPLCLKKQAPFEPVVYGGEQIGDDGLTYYQQADLPQSGLVEIHAAGSAGMLIRRNVLDALSRPLFETTGVQQDEDLVLCRKIREAGFKIHCDVDARLGHIGIFGIYPLWVGDRFGTALESGGQIIPLYPFDPAEEPVPA